MKKKINLCRHYDIMEITHYLQYEGLLISTDISTLYFYLICGNHLRNVECKRVYYPSSK